MHRYALLSAAAATASEVQWRVATDWEAEDASCDRVCHSFGFRCTESCWPGAQESLEALRRNVSLVGSACSEGIRAAPAQPWHPAKDAVDRLCYWDTGGAVGQSRCSLVPRTPSALLQASRLIRRICPCTDVSSPEEASLDCMLGSNPVFQPAPLSSPYAGKDPAAATEGAASNSDEARCGELCVGGFQGSDELLNGRYEQAGQDWSLQGDGPTSIRLVHLVVPDTNKVSWKFVEDGLEVAEPAELATIRSTAPSQEGVFTTKDGEEHLASFSCCEQLVPSTQEDGGGSFDKVFVVGLAVACVSAIGLSIALWYFRERIPCIQRKRRTSSRPSQRSMEELDAEKHKVHSPMRSPFGKASARMFGRDPSPSSTPFNGAAPGTMGDYEDLEAGNNSEAITFINQGVPVPLRQGFTRASAGARRAGSGPQPAQTNGPARVAAALGGPLPGDMSRPGTSKSASGIYEGPVHKWWEQQESETAKLNPSESEFEEGDAVRLHGFDEMSDTWNGAEGVVEEIDTGGTCFVRFADGRAKRVRPSNLDSCSSRVVRKEKPIIPEDEQRLKSPAGVKRRTQPSFRAKWKVETGSVFGGGAANTASLAWTPQPSRPTTSASLRSTATSTFTSEPPPLPPPPLSLPGGPHEDRGRRSGSTQGQSASPVARVEEDGRRPGRDLFRRDDAERTFYPGERGSPDGSSFRRSRSPPDQRQRKSPSSPRLQQELSNAQAMVDAHLRSVKSRLKTRQYV